MKNSHRYPKTPAHKMPRSSRGTLYAFTSRFIDRIYDFVNVAGIAKAAGLTGDEGHKAVRRTGTTHLYDEQASHVMKMSERLFILALDILAEVAETLGIWDEMGMGYTHSLGDGRHLVVGIQTKHCLKDASEAADRMIGADPAPAPPEADRTPEGFADLSPATQDRRVILTVPDQFEIDIPVAHATREVISKFLDTYKDGTISFA